MSIITVEHYIGQKTSIVRSITFPFYQRNWKGLWYSVRKNLHSKDTAF